MVGVGMHLVSAPPAHDRRREVLRHASHRVAHLRAVRGTEKNVTRLVSRHGDDGQVPVPASGDGAEHVSLLRTTGFLSG